MSKRHWEGDNDNGASKKLKSPWLTSVQLADKDVILKKRAEVAARLAEFQRKALGAASIVAAPVPAPKPTSPSPGPSTSAPPAASVKADLARRVAEATRRAAETSSRAAIKDNPYMSMPQTGKNKNRPAEPSQQGTGLKMSAHPLLLDTSTPAPQSKKDRYKPMQPKFASIKANVRNQPAPPPTPTPTAAPETSSNPYAAASANAAALADFDSAPRERSTNRGFRFNPKGKYVQLGVQMRQEIQLEALKQRIAEGAKKAGMDSEFESLEKNIRRVAPPASEWWDEALLPNRSYDDVLNLPMESLHIRTANSPINIYVQHPIPILAPGEKSKVQLKPLMLTSKEQKKLRKQKRQAELQDKRDRIRMGLVPPDAPKVRLANLMKVLTSDAVQDPTKVEAKVRREVAMRKHGHDKMNEERKLTDEQRREKTETKKVDEEKRGIFGAVFKVKTLSDPAHRYKVRKNAEQFNLTGVCIFHPSFSMIYVEGAAKFVRKYKHLMMDRITWTVAARPRGEEDVELDNGSDEEGSGKGKPTTPGAEPSADGPVVSLEDNKCWLVWEGQLRDRAFGTFKPRSCPTDSSAKEMLGVRLAGYWDQAKNWKPEEEELY
ncbi:PRP3-domain-containing protein [Athelia psychrophila]|uniref:PRP3-domain-containing protein n=1 Tax=Athelia psychrophila TaxID=1759441 RepID=A0A165X7Y2_9AGAM|nr:PRP3-domain-containing protein [Fibularhizoctonia sp. CBS 109695]